MKRMLAYLTQKRFSRIDALVMMSFGIAWERRGLVIAVLVLLMGVGVSAAFQLVAEKRKA